MYVNRTYLKGRRFTALPDVMAAYYVGFLMAMADIGHAGPIWKER